MAKAIQGAAELAGAVGVGVTMAALASTGVGVSALPMLAKVMTTLAISGISTEAGAIAGALTSNRGMQISKRQPASNRGVIYGTQMTGGVVTYLSTSGHQMNRVVVLSGHQIHSIQAIYIDGRKVHFTGSGNGWSVRNGVGFGGNADSNDHLGPDGVTKYNFGGLVYIEARYGDQPAGDYMHSLQGNDPNWGPSGSDTPTLSGCAYVYVKITANSNMFPQEPEIRVLVNGKSDVLDPRTGNRGFTNNAALVMADVITDTQFGLGDPNVDTAQLIVAANICDTQIPVAALGGGTESQYCCDYSYDTGTPPSDVLQTMLTGMAGRLSNVGGSWFIYPGTYIGPTLNLDKSALTAPVEWNPTRSIRDLPNRVTGTHIAAEWPFSVAGNWYQHSGTGTPNTFDLKFTTSSYPAYASDPLHGFPVDQWLTQDGGHIRPLELPLPTVLSVTQCQRVAKINLLRARAVQGSGTLEIGFKGYSLTPCDTFQFNFPELGWTNKVLEVVGTGLHTQRDENGAPSIRYTLSVQETDPSIYAWSTTEELTVYSAPAAPTQVSFNPVPPTNLQLSSGANTAIVNPDGSVTPCINVQWNTPQDPLAVAIAIQYRVNGSGTWYSAPSADISLNLGLISTVVTGQHYDVRIATVRSNGALSGWVEQDNFLVPTFGTFLGALSAQYPGGVNLPSPSADVTAQQPLSYTGSSESIIPNGDFVLGNTKGWVTAGGSGAWFLNPNDSQGPVIKMQGSNDGVCTQSFAVLPGKKYRFIFRVWSSGTIGSQNPIFRVAYSAAYATNILPSTWADLGYDQTPQGEWTDVTHDWTCPAGMNFASAQVYHWNNPTDLLQLRSIKCIPYGSANQWGADVTGSNTSNDTSYVSGIPSSTIAQVVPTGYRLVINSGARSYEFQAI